MYRFNKKTLAFTLAELLMVLGIIGVVATITLPNLGDSADQQVNVAKAKKVYSELSSAWDKYSLKHDIPSSMSAEAVMAAMKANLKTKGTSYIYTPDVAACTTNTSCNNISSLLPDGSTFSANMYSKDSVNFVNVYFDVDGPNKGDNTIGSDIFCASITFNSASADTPSLEPFMQTETLTNMSSIMTSGNAATADNGLLWILTYDNMDYNNCTVNWVTKTTCN